MAPLVNSGAPGQDVQSFINKFYEWSDNPEDNEPWINAFTDDAYVQIGPQKAQGAEEIRKLRGWIFDVIAESKHTVSKIMSSNEGSDRECMLIGDAKFLTKDQLAVSSSWAGHVELKRQGDEWKLASYRVWSQNE